MKQEILNLIDKVIGKKGIMRSPAWFVNKLFKKTLDYTDEVCSTKEDKIPTLHIGNHPENVKIYNGIISGEIDRCKIEYTDTIDGIKTPIRAISTLVGIVPNLGVVALFSNPKQPDSLKSVFMLSTSPGIAMEGINGSGSELYKVYAVTLGSGTDLESRRQLNKKFIKAFVSGEARGCMVHNVDTDYTYTSTTIKDVKNSSGEDELYIMMTFCEGDFADPRPLQLAGVYVNSDGVASQFPSVSPIPIIDNLESDSTTAALSANQGRVLSEKIDSEKENIIDNIVSNEEVIASTFNDIHTVIKDIKENISKNVTKEELQYEIDNLKSKIISNEEVIANALSDLNTKFLDLESRLRDVEKNTEQ